MKLLQKRPCPECQGDMGPKAISLTLERKGSRLKVEVAGVPANVCTRCAFQLISAPVAKYIDALADSLFESDRKQKRRDLPPPQVHIQFPPLAEGVVKQA